MNRNFLKKEISRETKNYNSNVYELYNGVNDARFSEGYTPSLFDDIEQESNNSINGNGKSKLNGNINGNSNGKVNGNSVNKVNGNPQNSLPVIKSNTNGTFSNPEENIIKFNSPVIRGKDNELGIYYLNDKTFSFSIDVPKNVVVKLVNFMGMNLEGLVDNLCMPGHYVVKFSNNIIHNGTAKYQMFIEDDTGDKTLENKPGRYFRLFEEKEIMVL